MPGLRLPRIVGVIATVVAGWCAASSALAEPIRLRIVGGLAGVAQFTQHEEPFWRERVARLSDGKISATIHAFDRAGLRGPDMLRHVRSGIVPFGTILATQVQADEPELTMADLPGLNMDIRMLARHVGLQRPRLEHLLREEHGIELLGIYVYPEQVTFCRTAFQSLADLAGRRVRTSSLAMSEFMTALGALPIAMPFAEVRAALQRGAIDCAVTGTLSAYEIGLNDIATYQHTLTLGTGLSFFTANGDAWRALPSDVRALVRSGIAELETEIWAAAEADTRRGTACNGGAIVCDPARPGRMTIVRPTEADIARRLELLRDVVLPRWVERCGAQCAEAWNATIGPSIGVEARAARSAAAPPAGTDAR